MRTAELQQAYEALRDLKKTAGALAPITLQAAVMALETDWGIEGIDLNELSQQSPCLLDMYIDGEALEKEIDFFQWRLKQTGGNVSPYHIQEALEHYFPQIIFTSEEASDDRGILVDIYTPCQEVYIRASRAHGSSIWQTDLIYNL